MNIDRSKIIRIALIALLSLSIMLGVQLLYTKLSIERSLKNQLSQKTYVKEVDLTKEAENMVVSVDLESVDDISRVWKEIYDLARHHLKSQAFIIELGDNPNQRLENLYQEDLQFALYEAIKTGNYTMMKKSFDSIAQEEDASIKVFLDAERLFLHVQKNQYYFYKILPLS